MGDPCGREFIFVYNIRNGVVDLESLVGVANNCFRIKGDDVVKGQCREEVLSVGNKFFPPNSKIEVEGLTILFGFN